MFDNDETIQKYIRAGKARLAQGDALVKEDVKRAWVVAQGDDAKPVDFLIFTVGKLHHFFFVPLFDLTRTARQAGYPISNSLKGSWSHLPIS